MENRITLFLQFENLAVIFHQRRMMADTHHGGGGCNEFLVKRGLIFAIERAGGFVQQHVTRVFQKHSRERYSLALTDRQYLLKIEIGVEAAASLFQSAEVHRLEHFAKLLIGQRFRYVRIVELK